MKRTKKKAWADVAPETRESVRLLISRRVVEMRAEAKRRRDQAKQGQHGAATRKMLAAGAKALEAMAAKLEEAALALDAG